MNGNGRLSARGITGLACLALLWPSSSPTASRHADACRNVDQSLTAKRRSDFAPLVAWAMNGKVHPGDIKFTGYLGYGNWAAVGVATPVADDGTLFFRKDKNGWQFSDAWAGTAGKGEEAAVANRIRRIGVPDRLAACFASQRAAG